MPPIRRPDLHPQAQLEATSAEERSAPRGTTSANSSRGGGHRDDAAPACPAVDSGAAYVAVVPAPNGGSAKYFERTRMKSSSGIADGSARRASAVVPSTELGCTVVLRVEVTVSLRVRAGEDILEEVLTGGG